MTNNQSALQANIWKLYILSIGRGSLMFIPIIVPFFQEFGLNLKQIFLLEAIYTCTILFCEIPSGYLSDAWGRKKTIILADIICTSGILIYALSSTFWAFVVASIIFGIGMSFYSGTIEAFAYDTLLNLKRESEYQRIHGMQAFLHFGSEAITGILGGYLALQNLRLPWLATLIPFAIAFMIAVTLREPDRQKIEDESSWKGMWKIATDSLLHNVPIRSIIIVHSVIVLMTMCMFWLRQPYLKMINIPLEQYGIIHAVIVIAGALGSKYAYLITKKVDDRLFLICIASIVTISYFALGSILAPTALIFFLFTRAAWGCIAPLTSDIMNRMTTSNIRATVLSMRQFGAKGVFTICGPFVGYLADVLSLQTAMLLTGTIGGLTLILTFLLMRNVWKDIPK